MLAETEGLAGFWRGNFINVLRIFPARGVLFAANDVYRDAMVALWSASQAVAAVRRRHMSVGVRDSTGTGANVATATGSNAQAHAEEEEEKPVPFWLMFLAGGFAGMTSIFMTYPLDVARTRLAGHIHFTGPGSNDPRETSMTRLLTSMLKKEGLKSWYKGVGPTLFGALPYEGIKFSTYGFLTQTVLPRAAENTGADATFLKLLAGAVAGLFAGVMMFPNDTVRKLMQIDGYEHAPSDLRTKNNSRPYSSAWDVWKRVYTEHGVGRFYRGVVPYMLRIVPGSAIQFGAYETLKQRQRKMAALAAEAAPDGAVVEGPAPKPPGSSSSSSSSSKPPS